MTTEEWREAPGSDGFYEVSSLGNARSWLGFGPGRRRRSEPRPLRPVQFNTGYHAIRIGKGPRFIHRMVCEAFHGPPPSPSAQARHLNDVKSDNRAVNLAWGTAKENKADAARNGCLPTGPRHHRFRTHPHIIEQIHALRSAGKTYRSIAEITGLSETHVGSIVRGQRWAAHEPSA